MIARIFKFFILMPVVAAVVLWHLATSDDWLLTLLLGVALYFPIQQLGQSTGHHKLFAHRAFYPVRWYPPVATFIASVSFFGDPLGAAMAHRLHHKHADTDRDPHSPIHGRFHSYMGWLLTWKPSVSGAAIVFDLMRDYPWMVRYRKFEWAVPVVFHGCMFFFAGYAFYPVALACLLSIQNGLLVNAFSHSPSMNDTNKAVDSPLAAKLFNPIFLHRRHHDNGGLLDYSHGTVKDHWAIVTRLFLEQKHDPNRS